MKQICNDEYWKYMTTVRDRTEGAPCGRTFEDVTQSTLCPHEELAAAGPVFGAMHFNWKTAWPHALSDVTAVKNTTDDESNVTCEACLHALGTQKYPFRGALRGDLLIEAQELELEDLDETVLRTCYCAHCDEDGGICPQAVVKLVSDYAVSMLEREASRA